MRTYDQIDLHSEDYIIFDDVTDRDKAIVELYDALHECVLSKAEVATELDDYKALFKYHNFVKKTREIHGM